MANRSITRYGYGIINSDFAVALGLVKSKEALVAFADPTIFLFFGGFALATALHIQ